MSEKNCVCNNNSIELENTHYKKLPISAFLLEDKNGYGIMVMEKGSCIACFEAKYCPNCGKKLTKE